MKINSIALENFKLFKKQEINFDKITLLTGANSSGKSTVLNALAMIIQTKSPSTYPIGIENNGELVKLGGYREIVTQGKANRRLQFEINVNPNNEEVKIKGVYNYSKENNEIVPEEFSLVKKGLNFDVKFDKKEGIYKIKITKEKNNTQNALQNEALAELMESINKIMSEKYKAPSATDTNLKKMLDRISGDTDGWESTSAKNASELIKALKEDQLYSTCFNDLQSVIKNLAQQTVYIGPVRAYPERQYESKGLSTGIDPLGRESYNMIIQWIKYDKKRYRQLITDITSLKLADELNSKTIQGYLMQLNVKPFSHNESVNITDVGFGISQILPILVANIAMQKGGTMLVNQPEVHLHPSAQAALANYFLEQSKDKNFIIETHSEYLINRFRLLVSQGKLKSDDIKIIYFGAAVDGVEGPAVYNVKIDGQGSLIGAPKDFFDTYFLDNSELVLSRFKE